MMTNRHVSCAGVLALLLPIIACAQERPPEGGANVQPAAPEQPPARPLPEGVKALRDLEYARVENDRRLLLDLYLPAQPEQAEQAAKPLPLVVWVHGGAWRAGSKDQTPAVVLTRFGYAVASIGYRLSQVARFPAQLHDCKGAIRWLRAHAKEYNINPDRIGAWGSSAGGHLVALLGTTGDVKELEGTVGGNLEQSSRVQAVCDWFGPSDFLKIGDFPSNLRHNDADSPESLLIGGALPENKEKAAAASPVTYATKDDPPFLIMHGDRDMTVPFNQSELMLQALQKAGVESTFRPVPGAGHGFGGPELMRMVLAFFDRHLKK